MWTTKFSPEVPASGGKKKSEKTPKIAHFFLTLRFLPLSCALFVILILKPYKLLQNGDYLNWAFGKNSSKGCLKMGVAPGVVGNPLWNFPGGA